MTDIINDKGQRQVEEHSSFSTTAEKSALVDDGGCHDYANWSILCHATKLVQMLAWTSGLWRV